MKFIVKPTNFKFGLCHCSQCDHCSTKCSSRCASYTACSDKIYVV